MNLFERDYRGSSSLDVAAKKRGDQNANNPTLDFLYEVLRVGGAAASVAWTRHQRRERRLPVVCLRALVVRGRATARREPRSKRSAWRAALNFTVAASPPAPPPPPPDSEDDDASPRSRKHHRSVRATCIEGPFRCIIAYL